MKMNADAQIHSESVPTPDGEFLASYSDKGLCRLEFPSAAKPRKRVRASAFRPATEPPPQTRRWHTALTRVLTRALAGEPPGELPPLDLSAGTAFQQAVWQALCRIPRGRTWSYTQVAQAVGRPKAVRAVGQACGANPIPVLVPCHRVLAAGHRLGGYSGGLHWKRTLLAREGIPA
jgi:O-6-methylguanine DNA methyltransferase